MKRLFNLLCLIPATFFSIVVFAQQSKQMTAHYIDVGQGQAMLLEFPKGAVLIDAGGQEDKRENLHVFLNSFFARRTDLDRTLDAIYITHQHIDHLSGLIDVANHFNVRNYIDNGHSDSNIEALNQVWMQKYAKKNKIKYKAITFSDVTKGNNKKGLTNGVIDPVDGDDDSPNPDIRIFSGAFADEQLTATDLGNENNHSLVIKVKFGKASFLFMGDLQKPSIDKVLSYYANAPEALKADILQVGHHGSHNATTAEWLTAVKPQYAILNVGEWTSGLVPGNTDSVATQFTTFAYGHPNKLAMDILEAQIPGVLDHQVQRYIGLKGQYTDKDHVFHHSIFRKTVVKHNIYATAWSGTISITATSDGVYTIFTER